MTADIFWSNTSTWREAQAALDHHMQLFDQRSTLLASLADSIADNFRALNPIMDDLCAATCPYCIDPCCLHADVRYDFRDLLFLHCRQQALPVHQPRLQAGQTCLFLSSEGCVLPRDMRPFLCTWYLCPRQMNMIRQAFPSGRADLLPRLQRMQQLRKDLEATFIHLVTF
jgi:hypothetical protein